MKKAQRVRYSCDRNYKYISYLRNVEASKLRLTQPSLAGTGAEIGNNSVPVMKLVIPHWADKIY